MNSERIQHVPDDVEELWRVHQPLQLTISLSLRRPSEVVEAAVVHPERQLPLLLRVHHRQGAAGHHPSGEYPGTRLGMSGKSRARVEVL